MSFGGKNLGAHQYGVMDATSKPEPRQVKISEIAATGENLSHYDDQEKVQRMKAQVKAGGTLPPVRLVKLTPELREKYDVQDPSKKYYLTNGHHRLAARKLLGDDTIDAIDFHTGKRL